MHMVFQVFYLRLLGASFLPLQNAGLVGFHSTGLFSENLAGPITVKKAPKPSKMMSQTDPTIHLLVTNAVSVTIGGRIPCEED